MRWETEGDTKTSPCSFSDLGDRHTGLIQQLGVIATTLLAAWQRQNFRCAKFFPDVDQQNRGERNGHVVEGS